MNPQQNQNNQNSNSAPNAQLSQPQPVVQPVNPQPPQPVMQQSVNPPVQQPAVPPSYPVNPPPAPPPPVQTQQPVSYPVQPPTQLPTQQTSSFQPAGISSQPNFMNNQQSIGFQPKKKSLLNNPVFIILCSVLAVGLVIGGWFAYSRFWVVDRSHVLIQYNKTNASAAKAKSKVIERLFPITNLYSDSYVKNVDAADSNSAKENIASANEEMNILKEETEKFNAFRDPEFSELSLVYQEDTKKCIDYLANANDDLDLLAPVNIGIRESAQRVSYDATKNDNNNQKISKINTSVSEYRAGITKLKDLDLKNNEVAMIRDAIIKTAQTNINNSANVIKDFKSGGFGSISDVNTFISDDINKARTAFSSQINTQVCSAKSQKDMSEIFADHDFNAEEKGLLEIVE